MELISKITIQFNSFYSNRYIYQEYSKTVHFKVEVKVYMAKAEGISVFFKSMDILSTPPRTPRVSRLKSQILKLTFLS